MTPEVPDNLSEPMPAVTYCKCAESWVENTTPVSGDDAVFVRVSLRVKCPACGFWTDAVPVTQK